MLIFSVLFFNLIIGCLFYGLPSESSYNTNIDLNFENITFSSIRKEDQVIQAFIFAWNGYKKYAWGKDELEPLKKNGSNSFGLGLTIVDALDTAIIMGLKKETNKAIDWIKNDLDFDVKNDNVNVFETTIRVLGGLLSSYNLIKHPILLEKAKDLGDRLLSAFIQSTSPIPRSDVNLKTRIASNPSGYSSLAEVSTIQLEFRELSRLTRDMIYEQYAMNVSNYIHRIGCDGLCPYLLDVNDGKFIETTRTLGARADSFYEYLLKQYLQTNVDWFREDWNNYIDLIEKDIYMKIGSDYVLGEIEKDKTFSAKMDHLACFLSGSLALSYQNGINSKHLKMAENIAETCYKMYDTPSGLAAEIYKWKEEKISSDFRDRHSLLRPEAVESFFYLYRVTGNRKYQDWTWKIFQSIQKYARIPEGYSSVKNVYETEYITRIDKMESFFLAETLKYIYLTMAENQTILPLDEWIFNTEAHPFPISK
ncbi:unnamed protein product [Caenorhabditis angaria]|uniref:alpha-1,2-Mannosidase n=1 Tax=Caenorhabditis angaria TaxID=860376 RepID=A0A9P1IQI8_9PELO|nr:unnamed protein product [Caenorhabditis angaria]